MSERDALQILPEQARGGFGAQALSAAGAPNPDARRNNPVISLRERHLLGEAPAVKGARHLLGGLAVDDDPAIFLELLDLRRAQYLFYAFGHGDRCLLLWRKTIGSGAGCGLFRGTQPGASPCGEVCRKRGLRTITANGVLFSRPGRRDQNTRPRLENTQCIWQSATMRFVRIEFPARHSRVLAAGLYPPQ